VNGAVDTYYSIISNRTNEVMRVLTIISTIILPLTFITGVFGMNVHFPFGDSRWAVWGIMGFMVVMTSMMLSYFYRKKWL
ncbi:MAG: magnesium transporter, partial [Firmicutes bacterium]|nr:magnesium transporter [Bacillota bacterium]